MDKIEKIEQDIHTVAKLINELEIDYSIKSKGTMYKRRLNNLTKRMEYQIQKLKKLGSSPVAVIDLVLKEKINNSSTFIEIKKRFTLVNLTRKEIEKLLKVRYQDRLKTFKIVFLVTGISED